MFVSPLEPVKFIVSIIFAAKLIAGTAGIVAKNIRMSSTSRTEQRTMTTMTLLLTLARLMLNHL